MIIILVPITPNMPISHNYFNVLSQILLVVMQFSKSYFLSAIAIEIKLNKYNI